LGGGTTTTVDYGPRRLKWPADEREQRLLAEQAASLLRADEVVVFPTDTVYGLAALPDRDRAMDALYAIKGRPREKAIALLVAEPADLDRLAIEVPAGARALAERYWPGALTLVLRSAGDPSTTVALRMPNHPIPLALIAAVGSPLATTSANRSSGASPKTADDVLAQLTGGFPLLIDGGACPGGVDSTVLDLTRLPARILRAGAISADALAELVVVER
jgi:L-threonylcarbamoyladenylate synthase